MAELEALSKLKMAGRLRFWSGTVEIDERELHAICDEIQAEHDRAISALNKAAGNWAKSDAELRELVCCKDCRFYEKGDSGYWCHKSITLVPEKSGFCAWGERRVN